VLLDTDASPALPVAARLRLAACCSLAGGRRRSCRLQQLRVQRRQVRPAAKEGVADAVLPKGVPTERSEGRAQKSRRPEGCTRERAGVRRVAGAPAAAARGERASQLAHHKGCEGSPRPEEGVEDFEGVHRVRVEPLRLPGAGGEPRGPSPAAAC
jgi:hypothetical protein